MLALSNEFIDKLNAERQGGIFVKAVDLEEIPNSVWRYFVDHTDLVTWNGNAYQPLHMFWNNLKTSQEMPIEAATISVSNLAQIAGKYIKTVDVTENKVILRILHLDLLSQATGHWQRPCEVLSVQADISLVTFTVGRRLGRNMLPRKIYTAREFPGLESSQQYKILGG